MSSVDLEQAAAVFAEVRPQLFGIAYRMLGSSSEAEDLVQDVWLRWQTTDRSTVTNPPADLASTHLTPEPVNGYPGLVLRHTTQAIAVITLTTTRLGSPPSTSS